MNENEIYIEELQTAIIKLNTDKFSLIGDLEVALSLLSYHDATSNVIKDFIKDTRNRIAEIERK